MSMVLIGCRLSPDALEAVRLDPESVSEILFGDLDDDDAEMPEPDLDIDKSWHGIHFLLTGTAWEVSAGVGAAILGGEDVGEDNGYGPARLLMPELVGEVASALEGISEEWLRSRYDSEAMTAAQIYPDVWSRGDDFGYLAGHFARLRQFYLTAAANGEAVLLAIT